MEWNRKLAEDAENQNLIATREFSKKIFDSLSENKDAFSQLLLFSMALTQLGNGFDPVSWGADMLGDTFGSLTKFVPKLFKK